jgi:hypothetical protein
MSPCRRSLEGRSQTFATFEDWRLLEPDARLTAVHSAAACFAVSWTPRAFRTPSNVLNRGSPSSLSAL